MSGNPEQQLSLPCELKNARDEDVRNIPVLPCSYRHEKMSYTPREKTSQALNLAAMEGGCGSNNRPECKRASEEILDDGGVAMTESEERKETALWDGQANIRVAVRLRPLLGHDRDQVPTVKVMEHKMVALLDPGNSKDVVGKMRHRNREKDVGSNEMGKS